MHYCSISFLRVIATIEENDETPKNPKIDDTSTSDFQNNRDYLSVTVKMNPVCEYSTSTVLQMFELKKKLLYGVALE